MAGKTTGNTHIIKKELIKKEHSYYQKGTLILSKGTLILSKGTLILLNRNSYYQKELIKKEHSYYQKEHSYYQKGTNRNTHIIKSSRVGESSVIYFQRPSFSFASYSASDSESEVFSPSNDVISSWLRSRVEES